MSPWKWKALGYRLLWWILPASVPAVLTYGIWRRPPLDPYVQGALTVVLVSLPFLFLGVSWLLSCFFHSSRLHLVSLFLMGVYVTAAGCYLATVLCSEYWLGPEARNIPLLFPVLIPLNFLWIHFSVETGFWTWRGGAKTGVLLAQFVVAGALFTYLPDSTASALERLPEAVLFGLRWPLLPITGVLGVVVAYLMFRRHSFYGYDLSPLFWAMFASTLAFHPRVRWFTAAGVPLHLPILFTGAGVLMTWKSVSLAWSKAYRDPLTLIPGRMALDERLRGLSGDYSIAMIDIDEFKKFNDKYGHDSGDVVLRSVARLLEQASTGEAYRFGGEEFTLVYPGRDTEALEDELESLRRFVADNKVEVTRKSKRATKLLKRRVTVSVGVAKRDEKFTTPDDVLNAADNAMFKAKEKGRNRVVIKN